MERPGRDEVEDLADAIDVHVLDITAQIEALLRGVRDVQRGILTVHQRTRRNTPTRAGVAPALLSRLADMMTDCESLQGAVSEASARAADLLALIASQEADGSV